MVGCRRSEAQGRGLELAWQSYVHLSIPFARAHDFHAGTLKFTDALVAAQTDDRKWVISSPNQEYIPEPAMGFVNVIRVHNGHFDRYDPVCYPQTFIDKRGYEWFAAIPRQPANLTRSDQIIWTAIQDSDLVKTKADGPWLVASERFRNKLRPFVTQQQARVDVFLEGHGGTHSELEALRARMVSAFDRLDYPASKADIIVQVACVQRHWLYLQAWFIWHADLNKHVVFKDPLPQPVRSSEVRDDLMGAFTSDPNIARALFTLRVPVWFMREPTRLRSTDVFFNFTHSIYRPPQQLRGVFQATVIYSGYPDENMHAALRNNAHKYNDIERFPYPADCAQSKAHALQEFFEITGRVPMPKSTEFTTSLPTPVSRPLVHSTARERSAPCEFHARGP